jgi:hypothetical protein
MARWLDARLAFSAEKAGVSGRSQEPSGRSWDSEFRTPGLPGVGSPRGSGGGYETLPEPSVVRLRHRANRSFVKISNRRLDRRARQTACGRITASRKVPPSKSLPLSVPIQASRNLTGSRKAQTSRNRPASVAFPKSRQIVGPLEFRRAGHLRWSGRDLRTTAR